MTDRGPARRGPVPPPNRKVRITGVVLFALVVIAAVSAATGAGAGGTTGRVILGAVAVVLVAPGLLLVRSRTPAVEGIVADERGLTITVAGRPTAVPWAELDAVRLNRLSPVFGGHILSLRLAAGTDVRPGLRPFRTMTDDGSTVLLIGLTAAQAPALVHDLPRCAGPRYSPPG